MPRHYKPQPGARPYNKTPKETLAQALQEFRNGSSQRAVCKKYGITRSSFQNHLKIDQGLKTVRKPGGQTVISAEIEAALVDHLIQLSEWGFPFDTMDLKMNVRRILDKEGRTVKCFKNNVPGDDWVSSFMGRHKDRIKNRICQNISRKRAGVSRETINKYFTELQTSIEQNIINYDETNLTDDPGRKKMIFKRGVRYPERIMDSTKSSTSLMLAGTATGSILPVYVVYKSENLWSTWVEGGPPKARFNRSKSGWFDHICFVDWFRTVALPYCNRLEGRKVLIGDNLSSHFSNEVLFECQKNNISFICLAPNATHLLQPLDVAFFRPMKAKWRSILAEYKMAKKKRTVPKDVFPKLLKKLMAELPNQEGNLRSGFKKCGIFPLDRTPVMDRLPRDASQEGNDSINSVSEVFTQHLQQLRCGDNDGPARKVRKKKIDIVPGRSITSTGPQEEARQDNEVESDSESGSSSTDVEEPEEIAFVPEIEQNQVPGCSRNVFDTFAN